MQQIKDPKRVGVVVPSMNVVVEEELPTLLSSYPVRLHWSRVGFQDGVVPDEHNYIGEYLRNLPTAMKLLMDVPVGRVYFACTSASVRMPSGGNAPSMITAWDCILLRLERLGITEVSLLTPYPVETEKEFLTVLDERGISVRSVGRLAYDTHFKDVRYDELEDGIARLTPQIPVLLPCTAVRTIDIGESLNGQLLISAVSAMAAHMVEDLDPANSSGE